MMQTEHRASNLTRASASNPVHFLRTRNRDGDPCFFVLRASQMNYIRLMAKRKKEAVNISDYGEILASGFGHSPTPDVRTRLKMEHGIELPEIL